MATCQIQQLAQQVFYNSITLSESWHDHIDHSVSACNYTGVHIPPMSPAAEEARNQLISSIRALERLVLGPKDTLQQMYFRSAETGVVHALLNLKVPHNVPQHGSISYASLADKLNVSQDRLTHLIRNAIVCSGFLAETADGEVTHSHLSSIWYQDPVMACGNEVMMDNLPPSAFSIAESFKRNPMDNDDAIHPFSVVRGIPLFQWFEQNPEQGRKFGQHMRAQSSKTGDMAVKDGYDWHKLAGKTLVDCGGSFGTVGNAILSKEPSMKVIVQDLPKVIANAKMAAEKENFPANLSFAAHSFLEPQPTEADTYLYRMVFHNWSDAGAKRILRALQPVLKPGVRIILIEYVMPEHGTAPDYAELATRRLDNTMYTLMNGKVRELKEFQSLFAEVEPRLKFDYFKPGQQRATHDPRSHSVMSWVMPEDEEAPVQPLVPEESLGKADNEIVEPQEVPEETEAIVSEAAQGHVRHESLARLQLSDDMVQPIALSNSVSEEHAEPPSPSSSNSSHTLTFEDSGSTGDKSPTVSYKHIDHAEKLVSVVEITELTDESSV